MPLSEYHKLQISLKMTGKVKTQQHRNRISKSCQKRRLPEEHRRKLRLARLKTLLNVGARIDIGATEFFDNLNLHNGFHIQHPNVPFPDIGYFADGYDPKIHAWFEFDTPFHLKHKVKKKDAARQAEIIAHFQQNGNPLTAFYRINRTGRGEPGMVNVLSLS